MVNIVSKESLLYQPASKFSMELIGLFTGVYDHIRSLGDVGLEEAYKSTSGYFDKSVVPKLIKSIRDHTGLVITKVVTSDMHGGGSPACNGMFAISYNNGSSKDKSVLKPYTSGEAQKTVAGWQSKGASKPETADQMARAMNEFNDVLGTFKVPNKITDDVKCTLYFDVATAYFVDNIVHNKLSRLTAQEQAAIVLHEIYHIITIYSYYKYAFQSSEHVKGAFDHFNKYSDDKEKLKFLKTKPYRRLLSDKNTKGAKIIKPLDVLIDELPNNIITEDSDNPTAGTAKWLLGKMCSILIIVVTMLYEVSFFIYNVILFWGRNLIVGDQNSKSKDSNEIFKSSDMLFTRQQSQSLEKLADEGAISHNMGSYLQSALLKLKEFGQYMSGNAGIFNNTPDAILKSNSLNFWLTSSLGLFVDFQLGIWGNVLRMHEPTGKRIQTIARQQIENIRMAQYTPELQRMAIEEYERCYEQAGKAGFLSFLDTTADKLNVLCFNLINIIPIASKMVINRTQEEQASRILTKCEALVNNDIYVSSAKIRAAR